MSEPSWIGLAVALGVGLLVGIERERRKGRGPQRRAAGLRTFALVTVAGALAQSLAPGALVVVGALAVASFAALAYWRSARRTDDASDDPGLTTEVALVVAYLVGVQCAVQPAVGAAAGAVLAGLLAAREHMHRFATEWLTEQELRDALVLAGVALLVLLILGIQAAAHVARRLLGERHALVAAGLLGGFVSSAATIATMGAQAHAQPSIPLRRLAGAATLSGAATWVQALVLAAATSATLLPWLAPVALAGALAAALVGGIGLRSAADTPPTTPQGDTRERRPLRLREALLVAVLLLGVSIAVGSLRRHFGAEGLLVGTAVAALADAHAPMAAAFNLHAQGALGAREALMRCWWRAPSTARAAAPSPSPAGAAPSARAWPPRWPRRGSQRCWPGWPRSVSRRHSAHESERTDRAARTGHAGAGHLQHAQPRESGSLVLRQPGAVLG
jgi:uncharacterized membrane protein (DUF4010 family)